MALRPRGLTSAFLTALLGTLAGCQGLHHHACPPPLPAGPWAGVFPTVLTPFCHGVVDTASLECQLRRERDDGVHGFLVLGTMGEGQYVSAEERAQVIAIAVHVAGGAIPVVVGIHTGDLDAARTQLLEAKDLGASAVLVKYTDHPHADGAEVLGFMTTLSATGCLPIFYYHYPSETGLKLTPEDIAAILSLPGVAGIKESTLDLREIQAHLRLAGHLGKVFVTNNALNLTQFLDLGGHGMWCPEAVLVPGPTVAAYQAYRAGHREEARAIQSELFALLPILTGRPTPPALGRAVFMTAQDHKLAIPMGLGHPQARLKAALNCLGVPTSVQVKCPLPALTEKERRRIERAIRKVKAIDWDAPAWAVPPEPMTPSANLGLRGMLLQTGALQLGPGVGRDLLRTQSDGLGGF